MIFLDSVKEALYNAGQGILSLHKVVESQEFIKCIDCLFYTKGKIVLTGIGKSGYIAGKIASTLSSLGKQAIFIHPAEASHGDLGLINRYDSLLVLSKSGDSIELENIVRYCQNISIPITCITMQGNSFLGQESNIKIILEDVTDGFDKINAPMSSTSTMLVLGDCIAVAIAKRANFDKETYKFFHPGGRLGKNMTKIRYIMRDISRVPIVPPEASIKDVILEITSKMLGITGVGTCDNVLGVITDGDLRRNIEEDGFHDKKALEIMTSKFKYLTENMFVDEAVEFLTQHKITSSLVLNEKMQICGCVNIHDLLN